MKDEFWSTFGFLWVTVFSSTSQFVVDFIPGGYPLNYYLCTGEYPPKFNENAEPVQRNIIVNAFGIIGCFTSIATYGGIKIYQV